MQTNIRHPLMSVHEINQKRELTLKNGFVKDILIHLDVKRDSNNVV